nr:serine hydrolase domain-containing protein [Kineosporia rhizophila]
MVACSSSLEKAAEPAPDGAVMDEVAQQVVGAAVPGFMARIDDGGGVERTALGVADRETDRTIQAADQFQIGSIAKAFMATLCLQLVDEGKVDLDASLAEYLPGVVPNGKKITVRMLLNHTSGLFDYIDDDKFWASWERIRSGSGPRTSCLRWRSRMGPISSPGRAGANRTPATS